MPTTVIMPKLGLTMQEGTIVEWKKREGEEVKKGEILFTLETEKVAYEVEAPASGILGKIVAHRGGVVPVGGVVAYILHQGEKLSDIPEFGAEVAVKAGEDKVLVQATKPAAEKARGPKDIIISPLARKIAQEQNVDIATIKGTGPGGRIVKEDVLRAVEERKAVPIAKPEAEVGAPAIEGEEQVVPLSSMRKVVARRMVESFQSAPHFYLTIEVDTKELGAVREQLLPLVEAKAGVRLTFTDLLIKVTAKALEDCPEVNCSFVDGSVKLFKRFDIGLVVAVEGGLIVPVIRHANKLSLPEIAKVRAELTEKARERKLSREEMTDSTFTISNLGMFGIDQFSAIIQPPEGAVLAVGRIIDKPVALNGQVCIRPMMSLTLSIDHRVLDGAIGARFLQRVKELIEKPIPLLM